MTFKAPYISPGDIERKAEEFLREFHSDNSIPIPIEFIIEGKLEMDIIPIPGLKRGFSIEAFLSKNLLEICVDEHTYSTSENRYRFSLAHELGHKILHANVWEQLGQFQSIEEWRDIRSIEIPDNEYGYLEFHANSFAGMILAPTEPLLREFEACVSKAQKAGVDVSDPKVGGRDYVETFIGKKFKLSSAVIHRRLEYLGSWR